MTKIAFFFKKIKIMLLITQNSKSIHLIWFVWKNSEFACCE